MSKSYTWLVVALLWVVALLNYVDRQVIFSVLPLVSSDLRVPESQLGLLGGAFLWIYGIVSPLAGFLADRFGRRRVILASLMIWSLVTYATGLARSFPEVLAAIAPRHLYIHAPQSDDNFRLESVKRCVQAATGVYALFGAGDRMVAVYPPGGHGFPSEAREDAYRFVDKVLGTGLTGR